MRCQDCPHWYEVDGYKACAKCPYNANQKKR